MRYIFVSAALAATASAHGMIVSIQGANGVSMPGLSGEYLYLLTAWLYKTE